MSYLDIWSKHYSISTCARFPSTLQYEQINFTKQHPNLTNHKTPLIPLPTI
jgi:hypothetical protein